MGMGLVWDKIEASGLDGNHKWLVELRKECSDLRKENKELREKLEAVEANRKLTELWAKGEVEN